MTAIERRQYILETLSDRRALNVDSLAKECSVSERTIRYDIEILSRSAPIFTVQGTRGGIRPVLILQNDIGNRHSSTTIIAPITSRRQYSTQPTHVNIDAEGLAKKSTVMLEQIRTIDKSRLDEYIGRLDKKTMGLVDKAIIISFGIKYMEVLL